MPEKKSFTRHIPTTARVFMGLMFFVFGLNGFLMFMPAPKHGIPEGALALNQAFQASGYMMQLVSGTQFIVGLLLLANRFVPLALALIAPVIVNIFLFHVFLAPGQLIMALVVVALEVYLAWSYRKAFGPMLKAANQPE